MAESDIALKINDYWNYTKEDYNSWSTTALENWDFMIGGERQWESDVLDILKREGRPALSFNRIASIVNLVSGYQRQNRQDIKVLPRKGAIREFAEIFTRLIKAVYDMTNGDYEESMAFLDGLIASKGWLSVGISYTDDIINGDLTLIRKDPFDVREDPASSRYDLSDASFIFDSSWLPKQQIELLFPKKKNDLSQIEVPADEVRATAEGDEYTDASPQKMVDRSTTRYLVKNCWWISYEKRVLLIDKQTLDVFDYERDERFNSSAKRIIQKMSQENPNRFQIISRVIPQLHLTTTVGDLVLQDVENPFGDFRMTKIPLVRFCPYWLNGEVKGIIDDLKDPQKEINKRLSQLLHNLNQVANSGWEIPVESGCDEEKFKRDGSKAGFVYTYKAGYKPTRIEPMTPARGYEIMAEKAGDNLHKISGVNPDLMGLPEQSVSGIAMRLRQRQGNIVIEGIFDNFRYTKQLLGQILLDFIRYTDVFSENEIKAIAVEEGLEVPLGFLKSKVVGKYGVKVDLSPNSPTIRLSNFLTLVELRKAGLPIPDEILIKAGDFPNKDEILEALRGAQEQRVSPINPNAKVKIGSEAERVA
jgi:hypothetical protein